MGLWRVVSYSSCHQELNLICQLVWRGRSIRCSIISAVCSCAGKHWQLAVLIIFRLSLGLMGGMQVAHSFIDVFIRIHLRWTHFHYEKCLFLFCRRASAPRITFVRESLFPWLCSLRAIRRRSCDLSLLFKSLHVSLLMAHDDPIGSYSHQGISFRRLHESTNPHLYSSTSRVGVS